MVEKLKVYGAGFMGGTWFIFIIFNISLKSGVDFQIVPSYRLFIGAIIAIAFALISLVPKKR